MKVREITIAVFFVFFLFAGSFVSAFGQTNVMKVTAAKSNDYGVTYFLPKTKIVVEVEISKVNTKAGQYSKYAEKYLGVTDIVKEDQTYYTIDKVNIVSKGVPDKTEAYLVELKSKTLAPFVCLTKDGIICSINGDFEAIPQETSSANVTKGKSSSLDGGQVSAQSVFTEEYLRAGSVGKMAEVAAKQIYRLRESRTDILTGDSDNAPRDGEAMKIVLAQLDAQEKALAELFTGSVTKEKQTAEFEVDPQADMEKEVIFRFSKYLGVVDADDLSGVPVYMNLKKLQSVDLPAADPKKKGTEKGIVYNLPGKASVEVYYGKDRIAKEDIQVTQFGETKILATTIFEDKKAPVKVYFYPETGAVRQIIQ